MGDSASSDRRDNCVDGVQRNDRHTFGQYLTIGALAALATMLIGSFFWSIGLKDGMQIGFDAAEATYAG